MSEEQRVEENVVEAVAETTIDPTEYAEIKAENDRLKAFHDKVTKEKAEEVAKARAETKRIAEEKLMAEGDTQKIIAMKEAEFQAQLTERDQKISKMQQEKREDMISKAALDLATELSSGKKLKTLVNILKDSFEVTEEGIKVANGKSIESLKDYAKKEYDFLCDSVPSSGGAGVTIPKPTGNSITDVQTPLQRLMKANGE